MPDLRALLTSPEAFRAALLVDTDSGPKPLGAVLDPWQRSDFAALDPAWMAVARRGPTEGVKLRGYLERPRGHSKTNDLAVAVCWALFASSRQVTLVAAAADHDQARLLRDAIAKLVRLNPWLAEYLDVQSDRIVNRHTESRLEILSADAESSYGLTPDAVIVDELTHWGDRGESFWTSLFSASAKRASCLLVCISNAGTGQGTSWQWRVREAARTDEGWYFSRLDGPVASWISQKHLAEQRRMLPSVAFDRLWLNSWTSGQGDAIDETDLLAAVRCDRPTGRESGLTYVAGLDLGLKRDTSALVVVGCEPGGERFKLAHVQSWRPKPGEAVSIEAIEQAVIEQHQRWQVASLSFDPWQAAYLAERLRARGLPTVETPFTPKNLQAMASGIVESFRDRTIELFEHPDLLRDLRALRIVEKSFGYRIDANRDKHGHADRAIALALAIAGARSMPKSVGGVFAFKENELPKLTDLLGPSFARKADPDRGWKTIRAGVENGF